MAMGYQTKAIGTHSTAMGDSSLASGYAGTAMGYSSNASGFASSVTGYKCVASGDYSFAGGYESIASGNWSFAFGRQTNASGTRAIAIGYAAKAGYPDPLNSLTSIAICNNCRSNGSSAVALGSGSLASGLSSMALATSGIASGTASLVANDNTEASGYASTAMGKDSVAQGYAATAMGYRAKADANRSFTWAGDSACTQLDDSCDNDREGVFAIIGGLCVDDEGGTDCPAVGDGNIRYDGATSAFDIAEGFPVSQQLEKGDVVVIVSEGTLGLSSTPYDTRVAGIVTTSPNIVFNFDGEENGFSSMGGLPEDFSIPEDYAPVTIAGRVPVKVTTENGPIAVGDLLTTSSKAGYAMKCGDKIKCIGATVGKALEPLEEGEGKITALLTLQ
jgi:hypothetical protein